MPTRAVCPANKSNVPLGLGVALRHPTDARNAGQYFCLGVKNLTVFQAPSERMEDLID